MFKIYVKKDSMKGFPVLNKNMETTAINWASRSSNWNPPSADNYYVLDNIKNEFNDAKIIGIDGRDHKGGNCWKMSINIEGKDVIFDLREDKLLEIIKESQIMNGMIRCPLTVIEKGNLCMVGGESHRKFSLKEDLKQMPTIKKKDLKIGYIYRTATNDYRYVYLGRNELNGKIGHIFGSLNRVNDIVHIEVKNNLKLVISLGKLVLPLHNIVKYREGFENFIENYKDKEDNFSINHCEKCAKSIKDITKIIKDIKNYI